MEDIDSLNEGNELSDDVEKILRSVADWAAGYGNHLKWNEIEKLKADMMNRSDRWVSADPQQVKKVCLEMGMRGEDAEKVTDLLQRRKEGHRLVPKATYRNFVFMPSDDRSR